MTDRNKDNRWKTATVVGLAAVGLLLTGCGGGTGANGTYYQLDDDEVTGQITIEGSELVYEEIDCNDAGVAEVEEEPSAVGQINDDGTQIVWASDDEHIDGQSIGGTTSFSFVEAGDTTTVIIDDDEEFRAGDEDEMLATVCG